MNRRKIKILFVRPSKSSFIQKDLEFGRRVKSLRFTSINQN